MSDEADSDGAIVPVELTADVSTGPNSLLSSLENLPPTSGTSASHIYKELQIKFNGFARIACNDLNRILDDAANLVTDKTKSDPIKQVGNTIIIEVRTSLQIYAA
jgi:hypothetical protein